MVTTTNLISYYKFDEASGSILDAHGSNNGTNNGAGYGSTGVINDALDFETTDVDYISLPQGVPTALSNTAFTINMWIKPETSWSSSSGTKTLFDSNGNNRMQVDYNGYAGDLRIYYSGTSVRYTTSFSGGEWYMLTFTGDASNNKVYINGDLKATASNSGLVSLGTATTNIGANYVHSGGNNMDGLMDEISLFDADIGSTSIEDLYNSGNGLAYPFSSDVTVYPSTLTASTTSQTPTFFIDITAGPLQAMANLLQPTLDGPTPTPSNPDFVGKGTIGTKYINNTWPLTEGLKARTTKQTRNPNLVETHPQTTSW